VIRTVHDTAVGMTPAFVQPCTQTKRNTVRLTPIGNSVPGYQEFIVALIETIVGMVIKIRCLNWSMVWQ
jgi:hypothetical protein